MHTHTLVDPHTVVIPPRHAYATHGAVLALGDSWYLADIAHPLRIDVTVRVDCLVGLVVGFCDPSRLDPGGDYEDSNTAHIADQDQRSMNGTELWTWAVLVESTPVPPHVEGWEHE